MMHVVLISYLCIGEGERVCVMRGARQGNLLPGFGRRGNLCRRGAKDSVLGLYAQPPAELHHLQLQLPC